MSQLTGTSRSTVDAVEVTTHESEHWRRRLRMSPIVLVRVFIFELPRAGNSGAGVERSRWLAEDLPVHGQAEAPLTLDRVVGRCAGELRAVRV